VAVPVAIRVSSSTAPRRTVLQKRHRWMLLLAFEVLVFGFTQAVLRPIERPGISVEQVFTPNHVVT
jgi:hypothetical protein